RAAARGAIADAAELAGQALRLTPAGDREYDGRLLALAPYLIRAGEHARATALLSERIGVLPAGRARAAAHLLLWEGADYLGEEPPRAQAIADSAADPGLRAQALARRALRQVMGHVRRIAGAEQVARQALAAASSAGPDTEREALVALGWARVLRGRGIEDLLARSAALPPGTASLYESSLDRPAGVRLAFRGELAAAREVFRGLLAAAEQRGEARSGATSIAQLCEVELRAGDTAAAASALDELAQWAALEPVASGFRPRLQAVLAAMRGQPRDAQALAAQVLQASSANTHEWDRLEARRAAGVAALLGHEPEQGGTRLAAGWEATPRGGGVEARGAFRGAGDLAEARAEAGRAEAATQVIARLARLAAAQQHPWGLATADRAAAVVRLAGGWDDAAAAQLAAAAAAYQALGL